MGSPPATRPEREVRDSVVIRFAGDSGDGMQLTGLQFTQETALAGSDLATFPDYPAEIRAPAGTTYGVSAFQIHFGTQDITSVGDELDVLVAMNPAALKVSLPDLRMGGSVLVDTSAFSDRNLQKAGYAANPLDDDTLAPFQVLKLDVTRHTLDAVDGLGLSQKEALRCRNMWALGLMLWMYGRSRKATVEWIGKKFAKEEAIRDANLRALNAGHAFGETAEMPSHVSGYSVAAAELASGMYRTVSGTEALAWGLLVGIKKAGLTRLVLGSYPITPASPLLHTMAGFKDYGVVTFQAEDEIAAVCAAIGASYAGALGVTSSSGPGIALKGEAIGLAIATELPLIIVNAQRAGPSTGLPTKTEQSDLYQAIYGRNADAELIVVAAATPSDSFEVGIEAVRLATKYMTPVIVLTDGFLANAAEPWLIPDVDLVAEFPVAYRTDPDGFMPFARDDATLARPWAVPGTPELEHRIGGLERSAQTGNISYDPDNHQAMTNTRAAKIARVAADIPPQAVSLGPDHGAVAVVGWGSTYGPIHQAVRLLRAEGHDVAHLHLRYLWPFPSNLADLLRRYDRVLVPEMNTGQLVNVLRAQYLIPAEGINQVTGKPFKVSDIERAVRTRLEA
ncbi:MAG: 2-oxoacid:acceptor oxidoreductase subunit alpha [Gemmatimonadota bacterium]|nr:2-oxoacid:acceptor oxidoreductase subunit alpha [Gemmatimonadota bacterium]